ncbi:MAG: RluA family pseudouridine synthase [Thermoanaerobaculum sp.]
MRLVVYEGPDLLVLNKPAGLSLATRRRAPGEVEARLCHLLAAGGSLLPGPLFLVHRLDVGTTGLVLVARNRETLRRLAGALAEGRIHRTYLALVWGKPRPREGVWELPLAPDPKDRRKMRGDSRGKRAVTAYCRLAHVPPVSLVVARPRTGRTHQIRVHLAAAGHPIVGDDLYGGPRHRGVRDPRLRQLLAPAHPLLHAVHLSLPEPFEPREFWAPLPEDFAAVLQALGLPWSAQELAGPIAAASSAANAAHGTP